MERQTVKRISKLKVIHKKPEKNEIYVKHDRPIRVYEKRLKKLVLEGVQPIVIHGLAASINKALELLYGLKTKYPLIEYKISSKSVKCYSKEEGEGKTALRHNLKSCVKIEIFQV